MDDVSLVRQEFSRRLTLIPTHGLGLSVDVYSPDLRSLRRALQERQVPPDYLEIFRATSTALATVRTEVGNGLLTYHGEGLWLTQPETADDPAFRQEVCEVAGHLQTLQSAWLNHECATKYMAGYAFGTYLPPLYTESSAEIVAHNTLLIQDLLDRHARLANGAAPLVLLEMPPLTYFVAGNLSIPTFFRLVTERVPCGLVLDIGHLWTLFRYSGAWQRMSQAQFVESFLDEFPLDRVVEIHVAGLAVHESSLAARDASAQEPEEALPAWTDAHAAPIPPLLFEMLDQVLGHPRLTGLRGLALEVDTKPVDVIVDEFARFAYRYAGVFPRGPVSQQLSGDHEGLPLDRESLSHSARHELGAAYEHYARVVTGRANPAGPYWNQDSASLEGLETYRSVYLPYEILHWGGEVEAMFPASCRGLCEREVPLSQFVPFWFRHPRPSSDPYDFFLLKIDRFLEFVREEAPDVIDQAEREAGELRQAYNAANELEVSVVREPA